MQKYCMFNIVSWETPELSYNLEKSCSLVTTAKFCNCIILGKTDLSF